MNTYKLIVQGKVQGVGYRNYAKMLADQYNITGTVRNQTNGNVMIIAQGDDISAYIDALKVPQHRLMQIDDIDCEEYPTDKIYNKFSAVY